MIWTIDSARIPPLVASMCVQEYTGEGVTPSPPEVAERAGVLAMVRDEARAAFMYLLGAFVNAASQH